MYVYVSVCVCVYVCTYSYISLNSLVVASEAVGFVFKPLLEVVGLGCKVVVVEVGAKVTESHGVYSPVVYLVVIWLPPAGHHYLYLSHPKKCIRFLY